jgi:hypothetical protein
MCSGLKNKVVRKSQCGIHAVSEYHGIHDKINPHFMGIF